MALYFSNPELDEILTWPYCWWKSCCLAATSSGSAADSFSPSPAFPFKMQEHFGCVHPKVSLLDLSYQHCRSQVPINTSYSHMNTCQIAGTKLQ